MAADHVVIIGTFTDRLAVAEVMGSSITKVEFPPSLEVARNIADYMIEVYGVSRIIDRFAVTEPDCRFL